MYQGELHGKDNSKIKYGLTIDPQEVPNKGSFRVNFDFRQDPPTVISLEQVTDGKWVVAPNAALIDMMNAILVLHIDKDLTFAEIRAKTYLYIIILAVDKANKFAHMEDLTKELDLINEAPNPRLAESKWVQNYMYFFLQNYKVETERDREYPAKLDAAMRHWQTYVAPYNRDVDVFDDRHPDAPILFTVPAMIGREDIVDINRTKKSLYQVIDDSKFEGQLNPVLGQEMLASGLMDIITPRTTQYRELERKQVETWDSIRARYGVPPVLKMKPKTVAGDVLPTHTELGFNEDDFADD